MASSKEYPSHILRHGMEHHPDHCFRRGDVRAVGIRAEHPCHKFVPFSDTFDIEGLLLDYLGYNKDIAEQTEGSCGNTVFSLIHQTGGL